MPAYPSDKPAWSKFPQDCIAVENLMGEGGNACRHTLPSFQGVLAEPGSPRRPATRVISPPCVTRLTVWLEESVT